ncbi:vacuolar calcium ion transporter [Aspergillus heteromorphus CBS 117.55]|uniref:Vacuolar calcium ion transporter n=1 Tax=Aspergillus heteromorphus CBS 117.55 TaxID=1448321 RepID=A0A317UYB4_9EURO|nr:vacuolar calcium ion transporter [Aspergillus heteromorphus CBS 117.55]PWY66745.1 vacuolar calcium ion transporter [Aspergillus heteromorphus CBS 117.55]
MEGGSSPPTPSPSDHGFSPAEVPYGRAHPFHMAIVKIGSHPYLRALVVFAPLGLLSGILGGPQPMVFWLNLIALVPLMALITIAIAELSATLGPFLHELLKATLGNSVELMVGFVAAQRGQGRIFHSMVVGSILCYSLLVLGSSFLVAGYDKEHLYFDRTLTSIMSSLMIVVCIALVVPGIMVTFPSLDTISLKAVVTSHEVRMVSYGIAIILLFLLAIFLLFQLKTHAGIFHVAERTGRAQLEDSDTESHRGDRVQEEHVAVFTPRTACLALTEGVSCLTLCTVYLVDSASAALERGTNTSFPVLIWVPLVGNLAKSLTIVVIARQGHVEAAVRTILNSVLRLTLLVVPVLVLTGWTLGQSVTLQLDNFEATMLFLAAMVTNHVIHEGRTNYFDGLMLCGTYVIAGVAFYVCPGISPSADVVTVNTS